MKRTWQREFEAQMYRDSQQPCICENNGDLCTSCEAVEGILMHAQAVLDMTTEFAKSDALAAKRAAANKLKRDTNGVNDALYGLGRTSHESVPLDTVNELLMHYGFDRLESMLLCGREGRLHEAVGRNRWLALTWYKYESGRFEVVAYVS